jgi:cobalt/nickel transport system permease protein
LSFPYVAKRTALILPFALAAAGITAWTSGPSLAVALLVRALLSAAAVVVLAATTGMPEIAAALHRLGMPGLIADTVVLTARYLQSIAVEAATIRRAMLARGGHWSWSASSSGIGVLFASSLRRSEAVHRAMLSRGYSGETITRAADSRHSRFDDLVLLSVAVLSLVLGWTWLLWNQ